MTVDIILDGGQSPRVVLSEPSGSTAEVLLYGGQVISWKNQKREELLFRSNKALWKGDKTIRGGITMGFPQVANFGSLEQPGFARNRLWSLDSSPSPLLPVNNQSAVDLVLKSTEEDLKTWPHRFELRLRILVGAGKLTLITRVRNTDSRAFKFTFALCNYLSVSDISEVRVEGLETLDYFDNLLQGERCTEQADALTFDDEIDRVYLSTPPKIAIIDHEKKRTFVLRKKGMPDAVVRNPWNKKSKALPDLGDVDCKTMLCVDSASVELPIILKPFEEWRGYQELSTVSSSYCSGQLDPWKALHGLN
ncbi:putative glucose-6-phosphate 1-epimerase [Andrographis paniculata]|uniref:putative glucose-6-phosphate 1-epimerase n=1 Tax=Andrographis paniculata TaxID=175694 RepID=UPI0021E7719F|nr:putative glucose-6-phosphate 1-epimerase [Andrographis paniculata]